LTWSQIVSSNVRDLEQWISIQPEWRNSGYKPTAAGTSASNAKPLK
jgi:hypothetical protein